MRISWWIALFLAAVPVSARSGGSASSVECADDSVMVGFSWIEEGSLAAMARPGRSRELAMDLQFLQESGIRVLISLTEEPIDPEILARYGIRGIHLPVEDYTPPTVEQIGSFLEELDRAGEDQVAVGMHCTAGMGRTGTMMATYFVSRGLTAEESLEKIRDLRPGSVETPEQEARVAEFAESHELSNAPD